MLFGVGDRVRLRFSKEFADGVTIEAGRRGVVEAVYEALAGYGIMFDHDSKRRRIREMDLEAG